MWYRCFPDPAAPAATCAAVRATARSACARAGVRCLRPALRGLQGLQALGQAGDGGMSNSRRSGISTPNAFCTREAIRVASSECPPSSKKLSFAPTRARPSTSAQIPAMRCCASSCGASYATVCSTRYAGTGGSALRSSFAVAGQRQFRHPHVGRRHHVRRQFLLQVLAQGLRQLAATLRLLRLARPRTLATSWRGRARAAHGAARHRSHPASRTARAGSRRRRPGPSSSRSRGRHPPPSSATHADRWQPADHAGPVAHAVRLRYASR